MFFFLGGGGVLKEKSKKKKKLDNDIIISPLFLNYQITLVLFLKLLKILMLKKKNIYIFC